MKIIGRWIKTGEALVNHNNITALIKYDPPDPTELYYGELVVGKSSISLTSDEYHELKQLLETLD